MFKHVDPYDVQKQRVVEYDYWGKVDRWSQQQSGMVYSAHPYVLDELQKRFAKWFA